MGTDQAGLRLSHRIRRARRGDLRRYALQPERNQIRHRRRSSVHEVAAARPELMKEAMCSGSSPPRDAARSRHGFRADEAQACGLHPRGPARQRSHPAADPRRDGGGDPADRDGPLQIGETSCASRSATGSTSDAASLAIASKRQRLARLFPPLTPRIWPMTKDALSDAR